MQKLCVIELMVLLLNSFVLKGLSLKCYTCRSDVDKGCDGKINESLATDCPVRENATTLLCRKITQKLKFKNEEDWTVIRECAYEKGTADCYGFKWVGLAYQTTCECDGEKCNGKNSPIPNNMLVAVSLFLLVMFNYTNCDNT